MSARSVNTEASVETGKGREVHKWTFVKRNFEIGSVSGCANSKMERKFFSTMYLYLRPSSYQPRDDCVRHTADQKDMCGLLLNFTISCSVTGPIMVGKPLSSFLR